MSAPSPLLLLLLLLLLLCTDRTTGDDHLHGTEEEPREEHFDELKWMLRTRLQRMARRVGRGERPKAAGAAIVAVDPIFLDLDNIESFNDISSFDTTTVASTTTEGTSAATTSGPLIIGVDAQGRNILRFMSNWESEMASLAPRIPTTTTEANTTTSTTLRTSIETTTTEPLTETTAPSTTPVTTVMSTRTSTMSTTTTPMETTTEATTTRTEAPSTLPTTAITMESTAQTTTTPIATTSSEGETKKMETTATEEPAFIQTSGSFERNNGLEENFMEETTLRSVRADTIQPLVEETVDPEDQIWWTPKPSFLGMSSILTMEQNDEKIEEETTAWKPLWASKREPITSTTTSTTTTTEATTTIGFYPKINRRNEGRRFMTKLEKVAEQSVINDLELLAGSMNMKELVSELRGEQKLPQVMDPKQTDVALAIKKKTLSQLEMLQRLAERKGELEELIKTQRKILSQARGLRTRIVTGGAEENEEDGRKAVNNVINEGRFLETPAPTTTAAPEAVFSPLWQRQLKKRKESKQKRRPRQRQTMSLHHFVGVPPRGPTKMIDNEITPSVVELTEILEREMRQTQREVLSQEMRQFCSQALCTFERGDMCHYETSYDELTRRRLQQKRRSRREAASSPIYVIRSWSNWFGQPNQNNIRIDKAPLFSSRNSRFAAVFLEPQQLASLSLSVSTRGPFTIRFRGWEATTGVRLRVCCDDYCPFSTDIGRSRKRWRNLSVDCPSDTHQIAFECENMGNRKGVCGIDDVFIAAEGCPSLFDGSADL